MTPNHSPQIYSLTVAKGRLVIMLLILASLTLLTVTLIALAQGGGDYASISRGANKTACTRASFVSGGLPMWPKEFLTIVHDAG